MKKEFTNIGELLYSETLPNGLRVSIIPKTGWSKSYAFFATDYGGADRRFKIGGKWTDTPAGVAHFLEHKMFDTPDGGNALNALSANGASPNAFTGAGITGYYFESTEKFYENLKTLLEFVSIPHFTDESVDKEQGIIAQEIRMTEDRPGTVLYYSFLKCLYKNHPLRDAIAGTVESIREITAKTLYNCHKVFYNPSNMALCVMGDVEPERVLELAREILPKKAGEVPERDYGEAESGIPLKTRVTTQMEVALPMFMLGSYVKPEPRGEGLLRQLLVSGLALKCLLGKSSPLYLRLYNDGLLRSPLGFELDICCGLGTLMVAGDSSNPERVYNELVKEVESVSKNGLDSAYFERIKKADFGARVRSLGSFDNVCIGTAEGELNGYTMLQLFELLPGITQKDCESFITAALAPERLAMSVIEPKDRD